MDTALGRISTYRLVLLVLAALVTYSLLLDLLGWLTFGILAMLLTLAVAVGVSWGASAIFARAFGTRLHPESALITGALLYFLFWPTLAAPDLAGIALAAAVAAGSKFLLAARGRHIFNPAAIGALVAGLTGLDISTWWVAAPAMLPAVVVGVVLVLYRTSKVTFAVLFLAVSTALIALQLSAAGMALTPALAAPLLNRPGLFLVGFMLTEPLTLPPRRWQQLSLAVAVGVIFALPFSVGPLYSSPELTLLIGNLLAFLAGPRRGLLLTFTGARRLTPTSREYGFALEKPVRFRAGQFMELSMPAAGTSDPRGHRRIFSLTSDPNDGGNVSFGLRLTEPSSSFKKSLNQLRHGDRVRATGIGGDFILPSTPEPLLLLAGGVGITPFISQLRSLRSAATPSDVVLIYAISGPAEFGYRRELTELGARLLVLAPTNPGTGEYLGAGQPTAAVLQAAVPDLAGRRIYVSGSPVFVAGAKAAARDAGGRRIRTDTFWGY
ncbi:oxidoreductase [Paenarthrobacter sp. Z7-10]|uniref:ferredoxin--NADP reductase n=1 Tax=Paenarthrobacter sp. Z7-10 TaxID=2787635 RepID=UPI0022A9BE21|nr:oxidoreductase [Paenarthrobacter sp. Z7-10]MCZ2402428.1 oxidoreductase [Paenarthrobacter sp. Z7-10]